VEREEPYYLGVIRAKVKVNVTINIIFDNRVISQYTELKLSCGNNPVVNNYIYSNSDFDLMTPK
jgi:hypothetical protein